MLCTGIYPRQLSRSSQSKEKSANGLLLWSIRALNGSQAIPMAVAADKQPAIGQNQLVEFGSLEVISKKGDSKLSGSPAIQLKR